MLSSKHISTICSGPKGGREQKWSDQHIACSDRKLPELRKVTDFVLLWANRDKPCSVALLSGSRFSWV